MSEEDLDRPVTRRDIVELQQEIVASREDVRRYVDILVENHKSEFKNLFDWTKATTDTLGARVDRLEDDHGQRLTSLEMRVTRVERRDQK